MPRRPLSHFVSRYRSANFVPLPVGKTSLVQENIVLVVNYGDIAHVLQKLAKVKKYCSRTTGTFPRVQISIKDAKVTQMIFLSGCAVSVGGKLLFPTVNAALRLRVDLERIRKTYLPSIKKEDLIFGRPENANLVFSGRLKGAAYDLAKFAAEYNAANYAPEEFPGANIKIRSPDGAPLAQVMVFEGGAFNVMGGKTIKDIYYAADEFLTIIDQFVCTPKEPTNNIIAKRKKEKKIAMNEIANRIMKTDNSLFGKTLTPIRMEVEGRPIREVVATGEDIIIF
jgi:TATA-box binding protein (TBP) (component of TFIID and TFIIIB)